MRYNTLEHESVIAEYVSLGMLEWQIGLCQMDAQFRSKGGAGFAAGRVHSVCDASTFDAQPFHAHRNLTG